MSKRRALARYSRGRFSKSLAVSDSIFEVVSPFGDVCLVLGNFGGGRLRVDGGREGHLVDDDLQAVLADFLRFVEIPLVAGARLLQHRLSMGAMPQDGDHGNQHSKDRNRQRNRGKRLLPALLHLLGKLLNLGRLHADDSIQLRRHLSDRAGFFCVTADRAAAAGMGVQFRGVEAI